MLTGSLWDIVGKTPLVKINSISDLTGCEIYGKAEFLNPAGSVKDRAAKAIILDAEKTGSLRPGYTIVEGTAGNTGIGLASLGASRGYKVIITIPETQSQEKFQMLQALGANVIKMPVVPFTNPQHFYHQAKLIAESNTQYFWANQFENPANYLTHYQTTGPEIWAQTNGRIDAFIAACGTGGTLGGVSRFLKEKNSQVQTILADPMGSGLYEFFKTGVLKTEGSSITEGIGIMRITSNFKQAILDDAVRVTDQDMISMLYHVTQHDGLFLGTSSALNLMACYQYALKYKNSGKTIVTILCDSGTRYQSRILNQEWLKEKNLSLKKMAEH